MCILGSSNNDNNNNGDSNLIGKRIELIHTSDPYTKLKEGDKGIIRAHFLNLDKWVIDVEWDLGSTLMMIEGVDLYRIEQ
ncbi:MAG: DUF4314 domain-containing protein [Nitrososphaeraceae archaeon]